MYFCTIEEGINEEDDTVILSKGNVCMCESLYVFMSIPEGFKIIPYTAVTVICQFKVITHAAICLNRADS